ncbi:MAG: hypothetical protein IJS58_08980 [Bacilli bacterium]|nr:hypothetical protein [Bacilli bacterium]
MKLFKKLLVLTISVFTLAGLASCGGSGEAEDYSKLTFEEVFEVQQYTNPSGTEFAPGLTMAQLRSKTLDGAYRYYDYMSFNLKANYKVKIKSVTFSMATDEKEFADYFIHLLYQSKSYLTEIIRETTPSITKTFSLNPECTMSANSMITIGPSVSFGSLNINVGKCTIYNFSFDFEVLGK